MRQLISILMALRFPVQRFDCLCRPRPRHVYDDNGNLVKGDQFSPGENATAEILIVNYNDEVYDDGLRIILKDASGMLVEKKWMDPGMILVRAHGAKF